MFVFRACLKIIMNTTFNPTHVDSKLECEWLFLHEQTPPAKWHQLRGIAATWLGMHQSLRRGQCEIDYLGREYLNHRLEWAEYHHRLLHAANLHYGHLHGHHRLEDAHYFPQMRRHEPRLNRGFDVLDNDHHHIESQLNAIQVLLNELRHSESPNYALVERLAKAAQNCGEEMYRHLADEEDLVIPILAAWS